LRILFMGSPEIAVPFLETLAQQDEVVAVVTQPDQPAGRGYKLKPPAVKEAALSLGLKVYQPGKLKDNEDFSQLLKKLAIDLIVIIAYGKILPGEILAIPSIGSINIHFSLLPKYRGPAPIQWALMNGEEETGVTIFWLNEKIDAGKIILQEKIKIDPQDNYQSLSAKLVKTGLAAIRKSLELIKKEGSPGRTQESTKASYAPLVHKKDALINWDRPANQIHNQIRGLSTWPTAYTVYQATSKDEKKILKITQAQVHGRDEDKVPGKPGEIISLLKEGFVVKCAQGVLLIKKIKLEGSKEMDSYDFLQGHKIKTGEILGAN
jgi:methionyl-tRNA formyltransferase